MNNKLTQEYKDDLHEKVLKKKTSKTVKLIFIILLIATIGMGVFLYMTLNGMFVQKEETVYLSSSTLMETIDIAELSTSQFTFNGIATIYNEKKKEKIDCQIKYDAVVNAKVDMKKVEFIVDDVNKKVHVTIPDIVIDATLVTEDENSFSFIPEKTNYELPKILEVCKNDAKEEAQKSKELLEIAEENLKDTITALLLPILDEAGYEISWDEYIEPSSVELTNEVEVVSNEVH